MLKVEDAKAELKEKSYLKIQEETAWKWASRAAASYSTVLEEDDKMDKLIRLQLGDEYAHEAIEHAALTEDGGALLGKVQAELDTYKVKAIENLQYALNS